MSAAEEFKNVGDHAEDLADGRTVGPGESIKVSKEDLEDPHNQRLVEEGKLLNVKENLHEEGYEEPKGTSGKGKEA